MPNDVHDMSYYGKCMIGGVLSCGITHTLVCPLDIVKCRKQVTLYNPCNISNDLHSRLIQSFTRASQMALRLFTEMKD